MHHRHPEEPSQHAAHLLCLAVQLLPQGIHLPLFHRLFCEHCVHAARLQQGRMPGSRASKCEAGKPEEGGHAGPGNATAAVQEAGVSR